MTVIIVAIAVFVADQLSKHWVTTTFMPEESRILIPHIVYLTYVQNMRGAFGLFGDQAWLLIVLAVAVLAIFWFSFRDIAAESRMVRLALGAAGNIADRLQHRYVVDFIDLRWWPVFNVADSCITIGVCLLIIATLARDRAVARSHS
jgi:signal peptidase II